MNDLCKLTIKKVIVRLVPFCMLLFFLNYIDRANIAYAALQMNADLGFTPAIYGFAAGIFFLGYFLGGIPSNLILSRVGARLWFGRIMITWGLIATGMAWVSGTNSFYIMRFMLGAAEAGLYPGVFYFFSLWIPHQERAKVLGMFTSVTAIANIVGGPLATSLLELDGLWGFKGWQLVFILEGAPSVLVGIVTLFYLTDRPESAGWLAANERSWLIETLKGDRALKEKVGAASLLQGFLDPRVLIVVAISFFNVACTFGIVFWLPQIVKGFGGLENVEVGFLSAVPFVFGGLATVLWGWHSDYTGDRRWHLAIGGLMAAAGFTIAGVANTPVMSFVGLCVATIGVWSTFGVFWAALSDFLTGVAAAVGFSLTTTLGALGGFFGPTIMGVAKSYTQSFSGGLYALAIFGLIQAVLPLWLRKEPQPAAVPAI